MNSERKGAQSKRLSNQGLSSNNSFSVDEQAKKADPFKKPLHMRIYECGDILTNLFQPYVEIDLNQWKKKYFLYGREREHLD
jgi:hypothetical protein